MTAALPNGWSTACLGDLFDVLDHLRIPVNAAERSARRGDVPYFGATGQVGWIDSHLFNEELVLLGEDGAPFLDSNKPKAYVVRGRSWVNNHAHVLRAHSSTPSSFWKYQLDTVAYSPFVSGTTRLKLSQGPMRRISLLVPPLEEQSRLADALDSYLTRLDDAVASLERAQAKLKAYRASVLKAAVEGRLVPTEASLARAEKRDYEPAAALLAGILKERRRRWEEAELAKFMAAGKTPKDDRWKAKYQEPPPPDTSTLPELPEGWCWASVDQLGLVSGGLTQNVSRERHKLKLPFLRVANVYANSLVLDEIKVIGVEPAEIERARLLAGDLLVVEGNGSVDQIGRVALWDGSVEPILHQNHLIKVRCEPRQLSSWLLAWLLSPAGRAAIERVASSTSGLHTLSISKVGRLPVPLPPLGEQTRVSDEVDATLSVGDDVVGGVSRDLRRCARLRQSILKWAFEGRLVDQDPSDEPADKLLARIRAERITAAPATNRGRTAKGAA